MSALTIFAQGMSDAPSSTIDPDAKLFAIVGGVGIAMIVGAFFIRS